MRHSSPETALNWGTLGSPGDPNQGRCNVSTMAPVAAAHTQSDITWTLGRVRPFRSKTSEDAVCGSGSARRECISQRVCHPPAIWPLAQEKPDSGSPKVPNCPTVPATPRRSRGRHQRRGWRGVRPDICRSQRSFGWPPRCGHSRCPWRRRFCECLARVVEVRGIEERADPLVQALGRCSLRGCRPTSGDLSPE